MIALSARYPQLREVVTRRWRSLSTCHMDVLSKSGRIADPAHVAQLIGIEDGAIMGALGQTAIRPVDVVHDALLDVVDVLAPRE